MLRLTSMESQPQNPDFRINPENVHLSIITSEPFVNY